MATRTPLIIFQGSTLTTALDTTYTVPANSSATITAATVNNSTTSARTITVQIGGKEIVTEQSVPAKGSITLPGVVAQHIAAGGAISAKSDAGAALNLFVSGYLQQ